MWRECKDGERTEIKGREREEGEDIEGEREDDESEKEKTTE